MIYITLIAVGLIIQIGAVIGLLVEYRIKETQHHETVHWKVIDNETGEIIKHNWDHGDYIPDYKLVKRKDEKP